MTAVVSGEIQYVRDDGTLTYEGIALLQDISAGSGGATNLSYTAATRVIASDTGTDATLPLVTSGDAGLAPASGGGTSNFLRADGTWAAPGGLSDGDKGDVVVSSGGTVWTIEPAAVRAAPGYTTTATAGGTTTLTAASADVQVFTGALAQTIVLPDVTTLTLGRTFTLINEATAGLTIQSSGLNNFAQTLQEGQTVKVVCVSLTGTDVTSWVFRFDAARGRTGLGNLAVFNRGPTFRDTPVFTASDATYASLRIAHGVAPSAPTDGDVWTTTAGMFVRINGATVGPLAAGGGGGASPAMAWVI